MNLCSTDEECNCFGQWNYLPEVALLRIFRYLSPKDVINAGLTCKFWLDVCYDESLWKSFVHSDFKVDANIKIAPGKRSWLKEYRRLTYHIPIIETEVLRNHSNQVLYVGFSHNGELFATCSKDASVIVWDAGYPTKVKYYSDMKDYCWIYTQYCQFNESDTLLLVSGALFGYPPCNSGEIAVFSLEEELELQCRVTNQPYDILGTWCTDSYLLSGTVHSLSMEYSTSIIYLNRASQETESEHVPVQQLLFRFCNFAGDSLHFLLVANTKFPLEKLDLPKKNSEEDEKGLSISQESLESHDSRSTGLKGSKLVQSTLQNIFMQDIYSESDHFIFYDTEKSNAAPQPILFENFLDSLNEKKSICDDTSSTSLESDISDPEDECNKTKNLLKHKDEKMLIFTTDYKTRSPHVIGFMRLKPLEFPDRIDPGPPLAERIAERKRRSLNPPEEDLDWINPEVLEEFFDKVDHLIDFEGHIIGMSLSPDHRYLFVNNRPWPEGCEIRDRRHPPPIAQEIDIHVIDLKTLKEVGTMFRSHKAYTHDSECVYIFLSVCNEYVASGAEDKHGYLWDRHYGSCLAKYPHADVVNSVAFNPKDPEMLVTVSDDHSIKIWRSKNRVNKLNIENSDTLPKGVECRFENKRKKRQNSGF